MKKPKKNQVANINRTNTSPMMFPRTVRTPGRMLMTSLRAGKTYPVAVEEIQPEESIRSGSMVQIAIQSEETEKMVVNATYIRAHTYFVPLAAFERFNGLDSVFDAYAGVVGAESPRKMEVRSASAVEIWDHLGFQIPVGDTVNTDMIEAYNLIINHRRREVSKSLPQRTAGTLSVARSLWGQTALARIVPDFDSAMIDASVTLDYNAATLPISGGPLTVPAVNTDPIEGIETLVAELSGNAGTISLAKLQQAEQLKAFAEYRSTLSGISSDELKDVLMSGMSIPSQAYRQPILVGKSAPVTLEQLRRWATDGASLDEYAANAGGVVSVPISMPKVKCGGYLITTVEVVPEPVFDRMVPMWMFHDVAQMPRADRDYLDPQGVTAVPNRFVDSLHGTPDGTFGYAPLNYEWSQRTVGMGGRYLRTPAVSATDEDQQHVWSVRTVNPVLDEDAFLVPQDFAHDVFMDTVSDPFITNVNSSYMIEGNTQFGPALYESTGDWAAMATVVPDADVVPPSGA